MSKSGKLKVFLGMCPGVGKTYAMLQAAGELHRKGMDVVVGIVETHGRKETASLLVGLETLPRKPIVHRDAEFGEFDLDGMLARHPRIAVVDELAHSNVPGSRHPKRWQDVSELLDAGVDVLTTLNIQHVESRADIVAAITRSPVRETVPDGFLDRADEIELVDLTPRDLQRRLEDGKVYLGERAGAAAANFFKESHLTALRQLALRYTAERVGVDLREFERQRRSGSTWRASERLLVAVGPSPFSVALIRRTRAMAGALDAPWSAVAVATDETLAPEEQNRLTANLSLARQLGAETTTIEAPNLVEGLLAAARERNVTQIVIGKSPRHGWRDAFARPPALRLLQRSGDIDVVAMEPGLPADATPGIQKPEERPARPRPTPSDVLRGAVMAAALALTAWPLHAFLNKADLAMLMLCGVIVGSMFLSATGTFTLAILTGLAWNYLFTEPRFSIAIRSTSDVSLFIALLVASVAMGSLSNRLRRRGLAVTRQQERTSRLLEINRVLTSAATSDEAVSGCVEAISRMFAASCAILMRDEATHQLQPPHAAGSLQIDEKEHAVAVWAYEHKQPAGCGTGTLPQAKALHLPLIGRSVTMGVLSVDTVSRPFPLGERDLLAAIASQLGLGLERNHLLAAIHRADLIERDDQLRRSLLDHVSHELRTPVAVIGSAIDAIDSGLDSRETLAEMRAATLRLRRVVDQLVESSRIESGALQPKPEWCDLMETLEQAAAQEREALGGRPLEIRIETGTPPLVWVDGDLLLAALGNLLANAGHHTPPGTRVWIDAALTADGELEIIIRDNGPGLADPARVFDRFHRGPGARPGGLGLGLSIVRGLIRGMGGTIEARNAAGGGAEFVLHIPVRTSDQLPGTS